MADIDITAEPSKPITLNLVGVEYTVKAPKGSLAIVLAKKMKAAKDDPDIAMNALDDWLAMAFGKKDAAKVQKRLEDPGDDLDLKHVLLLLEKLTEASTGNPTSSSPGSRK